jgi:hypothetical protein
MTPEQFTSRCRSLWHIGPAGSWSRISELGFRTAEQLIRAADLDEEARARLLAEPRRAAVTLRVDGGEVVLRDQGRLFGRADLTTVLGDGLTVADWVGLLNRRVYFFTDGSAMRTLRDKYVQLDGAQDVLTLSPLRLLQAARSQLELSAQNTGAIARVKGPQKGRDTFLSLVRFPDRKPAEVTVVDGLDDLSVVVSAERHHRDGTIERLPR